MELIGLLTKVVYLILHVTNEESFPAQLSSKEETKLVEKMMNGDKKARNELIEHNLRLVAHVVKKYNANSNEQSDLISIGTIGLIKGIDSFKPSKGTKLATYAARCIENEILMYFRTMKKQSLDISLDEPIDTDSEGNPLTLIDILSTDDNIVDDIDTKSKLMKLARIINELSDDRDKMIIIKRYGLDGNKSETQRKIAEELNISRSYVSRIEKRVL